MQMRNLLIVTEENQKDWQCLLKDTSSDNDIYHITSPKNLFPYELDESHLQVILIDASDVADFTLAIISLRRAYPECKVVVVSSSPTWEEAREAFRVNAYDFVRKPVSYAELRRLVNRLYNNGKEPLIN